MLWCRVGAITAESQYLVGLGDWVEGKGTWLTPPPTHLASALLFLPETWWMPLSGLWPLLQLTISPSFSYTWGPEMGTYFLLEHLLDFGLSTTPFPPSLPQQLVGAPGSAEILLQVGHG